MPETAFKCLFKRLIVSMGMGHFAVNLNVNERITCFEVGTE